jgi:hypothetical protein
MGTRVVPGHRRSIGIIAIEVPTSWIKFDAVTVGRPAWIDVSFGDYVIGVAIGGNSVRRPRAPAGADYRTR